jgi:5-methylcytosine-specific restriction enzyme A
MYPFKVGKQYTRDEVFVVLQMENPKGGAFFTGYASHGDDWFIFCGVGTPGRTGHDYKNHFIGDDLAWVAKTGTKRGQEQIERLVHSQGDVYVFFRENDRDPFTFAGCARPKTVKDTTPVEVLWAFSDLAQPAALAEEIGEPDKVFEGAKKVITVNVYERDRGARLRCIAHWGCVCAVCSFDFAATYGDLGEGFIHVHHLKPLGEIGGEYQLDPVADLRPVCPNCHAMLHRTSPARGIDELQRLIASRKPRV